MSLILPRRGALVGSVSLLAASRALALPNFAPRQPSTLQFIGGPVASLTAILTGGTLYTNGTYTNVPLTGGTGTGALATVTVSGGIVTAVTLTNGGAAITQTGAIGYEPYDVLSLTSPAIVGGTGSGFTIGIASPGSYVWNPALTVETFLLDACGGGGGGGAGQVTSGAGGGGGGGAPALYGFPIIIVPGSTLTLTCGVGGTGGIVGGAAAASGIQSLITSPGLITDLTDMNIGPGFFGLPAAAGVGGSGGGGGAIGGLGGTAGLLGALAVYHGGPMFGGGGGGGGGSTATVGGGGAAGYPYVGGAAGAGVGSGGGGGPSMFGRGGHGGTGGGAPSIGIAGQGPGGGGGGGGLTFNGGPGRSGMIQVRMA